MKIKTTIALIAAGVALSTSAFAVTTTLASGTLNINTTITTSACGVSGVTGGPGNTNLDYNFSLNSGSWTGTAGVALAPSISKTINLTGCSSSLTSGNVTVKLGDATTLTRTPEATITGPNGGKVFKASISPDLGYAISAMINGTKMGFQDIGGAGIEFTGTTLPITTGASLPISMIVTPVSVGTSTAPTAANGTDTIPFIIVYS